MYKTWLQTGFYFIGNFMETKTKTKPPFIISENKK